MSLTACGSDSSEPADEEPAEHACEQVAIAGTQIAAAADRMTAPAMTVSEEPYTVALVVGMPSYVKLEGPLTGLLFARIADVVNALYEGDGTSSVLPEAAPNESCAADIPDHFDLDLGQATFYLELGPAAVDSVWLMLISAAGHAH